MGACAWLVQECAHSRVRPCARHGYKSFLRDGTKGGTARQGNARVIVEMLRAQARRDVKMNEATLERIRKFKSSEGVWKC